MRNIQNFLCQEFGMTKDGSGTAIITLIVFILGYLITGIIKFFGSLNERNDYRAFLRMNLNLLVPNIKEQALAFEKFRDQIDINKNETWNIQQIVLPSLDVIEQLKFKDIFESCLNGIENSLLFNVITLKGFRGRKRNQVIYNELLNSIYFLKTNNISSFKYIENYLSKYNEFNNLRNESLAKAHQIIDGIRLKLNGKNIEPKLKAYFEEIEEIMFILKEQKNYTNPKTMNEYFVKKFLNINRNRDNLYVLDKYEHLLQPIKLNAALLEASLRYDNQKRFLEGYHENIKSLSSSYHKYSEQLIKANTSLT